MRKYYIILVILLSIFMVSNGYSQTGALTNLNNVVKFTSGNAQPVTNSVDVTVATMYGGSATIAVASYLPIGNLGRQVWTITVTNQGNSIASFTGVVINSNIQYGTTVANGWSHHFNSFAAITSLAPGGFGTFEFVITNISPASNNSFLSYLVKVSNTTAPYNAYAYLGTDGVTWYGGDLGRTTNNNATGKSNQIFLQHGAGLATVTNQAGYLTAIISGPILKISKTIEAITDPSGLYGVSTTIAAPGSYVTYRIVASNIGSASATNIKIIDTTALTNYIAYVGVTGTSTNLTLNSVSTNGSGQIEIRFTNVNLPETPGSNFAVIRFRVRIK